MTQNPPTNTIDSTRRRFVKRTVVASAGIGLAPLLGSRVASAEPREVRIDVKHERINPDGKGPVPVAIEATDGFDPSTVDENTVRFGDPEDVKSGGGAYATRSHPGKGGSLVLHFPVPDAGFDGDESTARLEGKTDDETSFYGTDDVAMAGGGSN